MLPDAPHTSYTMNQSSVHIHCLLSVLEDELTRQAREVATLTADVVAMETQLQQMLRTLSELNPETITCTAQ